MPYDKDLRDLLKATQKVSKPLPETVEQRKKTIRQKQAGDSRPEASEQPQVTS